MQSCKPRADYSKQLATLDSLSKAFDAAEKEFTSIDSAKVREQLDSINKNLDFIQQNYKDTMPKDMAYMLSDYRDVKFPLEEYTRQKNAFYKELSFSRDQFRNLEHDLKNNLVEKEKAEEYFMQEKKAGEQLCRSLNALTSSVKEKSAKFEPMTAKAVEVINKLKEKTKPPISFPR